MKVQTDPPIHLTYCLNVHPGESWAENFQAIRDQTLRVRDDLGLDGLFGLGLRLSAQAAHDLTVPEAFEDFRAFLDWEGLYVFTINGFPYGQFHDTAVKQSVYAPDWRTHERRDYTRRLADLLARLLPEGVSGSISTVPGSYKPWIAGSDDVQQMTAMLCDTVAHLNLARHETGRDICIALEPEPDCYVETTDEVIAFFTGPLLEYGVAHLTHRHHLGEAEARDAIRRHLGVCFDTSHLAVEFEDLAASLTALKKAGVRIGKVHLSAALEAPATPAAAEQLQQFVDPVYLHQVKARTADGSITSYDDLPPALAATGQADDTRRIHFHVPLFFERLGELTSTNSLLTGAFAAALRAGATEHIEIETYTFNVLPADLQTGGLTQSIAREYDWVQQNVLGA